MAVLIAMQDPSWLLLLGMLLLISQLVMQLPVHMLPTKRHPWLVLFGGLIPLSLVMVAEWLSTVYVFRDHFVAALLAFTGLNLLTAAALWWGLHRRRRPTKNLFDLEQQELETEQP